MSRRVFVTGTAGFIGFHVAKKLLEQGELVHGWDGITDYYDPRLKRARHAILNQYKNFTCTEQMLENRAELERAYASFEPEVVVHLAAQAGVRYSIEDPYSYIDSNIVGVMNLLELARNSDLQHLVMASTSSVYGANDDFPFREKSQTEMPMSLYAATKKANEMMAHSYAHLFKIPTTMFRFFTVYGPWGRPDMALFKFTDAILEGRPIDVFNHGKMARDFTYVGDIARGICELIDVPPQELPRAEIPQWDSLSCVAPFRTVNIGNSNQVSLMDFIAAVEGALGRKADYNFLPMQPGDVPSTQANTELIYSLTGFKPSTDYRVGVQKFVDWYLSYTNKS